MKTEKVVIEEFDGLFSLYDQNGCAIEHDFTTEEEAHKWAYQNGYRIVESFNFSKS